MIQAGARIDAGPRIQAGGLTHLCKMAGSELLGHYWVISGNSRRSYEEWVTRCWYDFLA